MVKIKKACFLLLLFSILVYDGYKYWEWKNEDAIPPVIYCDSDTIIVSAEATEAELMEGVTAVDDVSGDVSDSLVIEKISSFTEKNTRIITYAAIDDSGNVSRIQRTLIYRDYQEPRFVLKNDLRYPIGKAIAILGDIGAESVLDGNLTDHIKYYLSEVIDLNNPGEYQIEFSVTDSTGTVSYLPVEIVLYDIYNERITVELSEYLVYIPLDGKFDAREYFVGSDGYGVLSIESNVDTSKAGTYYVDYTVTGENTFGTSRLVVVVTDY